MLALYGRNMTMKFPNGVRSLFLLPIKYIHKPHTRIKLNPFRSRQQLFTKCVLSSETWSISSLGFPAVPQKNTLRHITMSLRSKKVTDQPLFINVNKNRSGNGYSLHFLLQFEQEARLMVKNSIPYITHHYGEWTTSLFSTEAIASSGGDTWDDEIE